MKNKSYLLLFGLLLFIFGLTSIAMELVGTHWYFLGWLERGGRLLAFVVKILMVMGGLLCIVFARTDWEKEKAECADDPDNL